MTDRWAVRHLGRDVKAVARDLRAVYRTVTHPEALTYRGVRLDLDADWATVQIRDALYNDYYEAPEHDILKATLRSDDRYLEIGAGIGFMATAACAVVGDDRVTVFEANPALIDVIRSTGRLNGFAPAVRNAVLSRDDDRPPTIDFHVTSDFWASSLTPSAMSRAVSVETASLADVLAEERPSYLVVDIEGGEIDLLAGGVPPFIRALCLEVHPQVTGDEATRRLLADLLDGGLTLHTWLSGRDSVFLYRPE